MRVTLLTNGPGELWGWVRPLASELKRRGHSVSLWLLLCPFASGHEREAAQLLGVDELRGPDSALRLWRDMAGERTDRVVQLGGDLLFGSHVARAAKAPLFCYTYGSKKGARAARVFTAYPVQASQIPGAAPIGDLVKDALEMDAQASDDPSKSPWEAPGGKRVLFLPGSRPAIRGRALPWLAEVKSALSSQLPGVQVSTLFPPFAPESELREWRDAGLNPTRTGAGAVMRNADFALTQPGTNTLELMHCGLPALVVAPSSFFDLIPVAGLLGAAASLPWVGLALRRRAARRILNRWGGMLSLPNRIAARPVLDEKFGDITPGQVAEFIAARLRDPEGLTRTRAELLSLSGAAGAAGRLCDALEESSK